jgi:hypothetical protein
LEAAFLCGVRIIDRVELEHDLFRRRAERIDESVEQLLVQRPRLPESTESRLDFPDGPCPSGAGLAGFTLPRAERDKPLLKR